MRRPAAILFAVSSIVCVVAVVLWAGSFTSEYNPTAFFFFAYHPTNATPQLQCVWLVSGTIAIISGGVTWRSRVRRRRWARQGFCVHCGYDLRATKERCPECGTVPTKATA